MISFGLTDEPHKQLGPPAETVWLDEFRNDHVKMALTVTLHMSDQLVMKLLVAAMSIIEYGPGRHFDCSHQELSGSLFTRLLALQLPGQCPLSLAPHLHLASEWFCIAPRLRPGPQGLSCSPAETSPAAGLL
jgi:hypothetical protein